MKLRVFSFLVGILMIPMVAFGMLSSYSFELTQCNLGTQFEGPFVKATVTYFSDDMATLKLEGLSDANYIYKFNEVGLNSNGYVYRIIGNGYTIYDNSTPKYEFSDYGKFETDIHKSGSQGWPGSVSTLTMVIMGLNGSPLFREDEVPIATHIFAGVQGGTSAINTGFASITPVPIPSTAILFSTGLLSFIGIKRRKV